MSDAKEELQKHPGQPAIDESWYELVPGPDWWLARPAKRQPKNKFLEAWLEIVKQNEIEALARHIPAMILSTCWGTKEGDVNAPQPDEPVIVEGEHER